MAPRVAAASTPVEKVEVSAGNAKPMRSGRAAVETKLGGYVRGLWEAVRWVCLGMCVGVGWVGVECGDGGAVDEWRQDVWWGAVRGDGVEAWVDPGH